MGNGTYEGAVTLDAGKSPAVLTIDDEMTGATLRKYGGAFYSLIDVKGSGDSIAAIMASLEGQFKFEVRGATLDKSLMTGFGSGLIDTLNPFQESGGKTELTCAVALFDIKDGIADAKRKIAAQLTKVTWFGGGQIDLKTEKIDFALHPEPRRGLGLDMGGLAQMVGIGETLAHPGIVMDAKKIAKKQMMWSAHTLTGGITLLVEELWDRTRANSDICAKILEGVNTK